MGIGDDDAMSETFMEALGRISPSSLPYAMSYLVSTQADDPPPGRIRDRLVAEGVEIEALDKAVAMLMGDAALLEAVSISILQAGWEDPVERDLTAGALTAARTKLPVVEHELIAVVAILGMWLSWTKGRKSHRRVVRRDADGSFEESETTEWYGPAGFLEALAKVLSLGAGDEPGDGSEDGGDGPGA